MKQEDTFNHCVESLAKELNISKNDIRMPMMYVWETFKEEISSFNSEIEDELIKALDEIEVLRKRLKSIKQLTNLE